MQTKKTARGFTLIELLVVITIIVVLLAMLTPALDRAIYQTELTECAARLRSHAGAAIAYAFDHNRQYLFRDAIRNGTAYRPDYLAFTGQNPLHDDRPRLRPYMPINKFMACPFVDEVDFDNAERPGNLFEGVLLYNSYSYWYGFRYIGRKGMMKVGDRLEWQEDPAIISNAPLNKLNVLVNDTLIVDFNSDWTNSAHTDKGKDPFLALTTIRNAQNATARSSTYYSYYGRWGMQPAFGEMDRNFAMDDQSVQMLTDLVIDDERLVAVGGHTNLTVSGEGTDAGYRTWVPTP